MEIKIIDNKSLCQSWNQFLFENNGSFLQSFEWGEFQKSLGKQIWRIQVREKEIVSGQTLVVEEVFPFKKKSCFYIPFGPVFKKELSPKEQKEIIAAILEKIQNIVQTERAVFLRIEPYTGLMLPDGLSVVIPGRRIQPQKTLILDLLQGEDEIFKDFSSKTRYNIRLAEKKGVRIEFSDQYNPAFYSLIEKTSKRDKFHSFNEEHYRKLFACASQNFKIRLCSAIYEDKVIASYILIIFGESAVCLHGASDWDYRALKAPNLAQWARIKTAKEMGAKKIDFWGIDEKKWPGITNFKKGFDGIKFVYPPTRDIIFQRKWYKFYNIARRVI